MRCFESDYFGLSKGTWDSYVYHVAHAFTNDPYKSPEQVAQARDYIDRYDAR